MKFVMPVLLVALAACSVPAAEVPEEVVEEVVVEEVVSDEVIAVVDSPTGEFVEEVAEEPKI